jgi:hypothetical protein
MLNVKLSYLSLQYMFHVTLLGRSQVVQKKKSHDLDLSLTKVVS